MSSLQNGKSLPPSPKFLRFPWGAALTAAIAAALLPLCRAVKGLTVDLLIFYLKVPQGQNANYSVVWKTALFSLLAALAAFALVTGIWFWCRRRLYRDEPAAKAKRGRHYRRLIGAGAALFLCGGIAALGVTIRLPQYLYSVLHSTTLFEEEYVDPADQYFSFDHARNLIYLVLESEEATCMNRESGGQWEYSLLPNLTALAQENLRFTDFVSATGTDWTVAALVAQSSGLPLKLPIEQNSYGDFGTFLPKVCTLGDILYEAGYQNVFLCGSDADFGGRSNYYTQHGDYEIFDYDVAAAESLLPEGYPVFWGYEDAKLYEFAKEKLLTLASSGKPFNLTMLTVDTHFVGGYPCQLCASDYDSQYENVIACSDRQAAEFVRWVQQQSFYPDTTIIITGDHLCMDYDFFRSHGVADEDRRVYQCIINPVPDPAEVEIVRTYTALDMFPTILSAMGVEWNGGRLGLGTSLFSGEETLAEQMGLAALNRELSLKSSYYEEHFLYGGSDSVSQNPD